MSDLLQENTEEVKEVEKIENNVDSKEMQTVKKVLTTEEVNINKDTAIRRLSSLLDKYISNPDTLKNANNLSYWLSSYSSYLDFEKEFDSTRLKSYKYGDVIKVNLGYNIGDEEGGLHYCVVMDKKNNKSSKIVTVVPLSSVKENKEIHKSCVFLGNEIYTNFEEKYNTIKNVFIAEATEVLSMKNNSNLGEVPEEFTRKLNKAMEDLKTLEKFEDEISKMKKGSIALVNQITTVSKQRIYNPQRYSDILSGLQLSDNSLKLICNKLKQLFIKNFED